MQDTGIGIPPEQQPTIFETFTQAETSVKRQYGGTGLGPAITCELVELWGAPVGRIPWLWEYRSTAPSTSTVTPNLCRPRRQRAACRRRDLPGPGVDDNAMNRRILTEMLKRWGTRPTAVESGQAASAAVSQTIATSHLFSLGLLDGSMPDTDGRDPDRSAQRAPGTGDDAIAEADLRLPAWDM